MASREIIKIANVDDLHRHSDLLENNSIVKNNGVWKIRGIEGVELSTHLFDTLFFLGKLGFVGRNDALNEYEYNLKACKFDYDEKYYKQLCRFTYNRRFWGLYDIERVFTKIGFSVLTRYSYMVFPTAKAVLKVKCLVLSKVGFKLVLPYFSKINNLLGKNALYKQIVQIVSKLYLFDTKYPYIVSINPAKKLPPDAISTELKREWDYQFKQISDRVLVWANYEEGQYDNIR